MKRGMCNLDLSMKNKAKMVHAGIPLDMVKLMRPGDKPSHTFVIATVDNLAEIGGSVCSIMLEDGCLDQLIELLIECADNTNRKLVEINSQLSLRKFANFHVMC